MRQQCTEKIEVLLGLGILQWVSTYFFFAAGPLQCYTRLQSSAPPDAQSLVRIIHKYKPTGTTCTVFLMRQFLVAAGNGCDLSSFKHIGIGGSSFEKPLLDKFRQICPATLHFVYGMTELVVPVFEFDENTPENSTGYPMDKYQYKLVDDDGSEIEKSFRTGELWVKGENFFKGYLNNPEQTEEMLTVDGWVKTGDMFYRDDQGFYFYVERKRLLIKHLGYMVSPSQMEEVIKRHPGVLEACVVGVPDPDCMERPVAAVSRRNGYKVDPEEIFTLLKNSLSKYNQLSGGLFFVDSFPVTPSQKINRKQVLELARTTPLILPK